MAWHLARHGASADRSVYSAAAPRTHLKTTVRVGRDLVGVSSQLRSITQGKLADIIAVRGDPLRDVRVLEDVRL
jgi:imidazolonepropionase-like amidohydrolase